MAVISVTVGTTRVQNKIRTVPMIAYVNIFFLAEAD
jgi:hypothetical protein